jgi:hypothetical protein
VVVEHPVEVGRLPVTLPFYVPEQGSVSLGKSEVDLAGRVRSVKARIDGGKGPRRGGEGGREEIGSKGTDEGQEGVGLVASKGAEGTVGGSHEAILATPGP